MKRLLTLFLIALLTLTVTRAADLTYSITGVNNSTHSVSGSLSGAPAGVSVSVTTANAYSNGAQITTGYSPFTITITGFTSAHKLTGITLNYRTNASSGAGSIRAELGSTLLATYQITKPSSGGTNLRDAVMNITETAFNGDDLVITVNVTTNSVYVHHLTVSYENNSSVQQCAAPTFSPAAGTYSSA